jgi:hypothetical protein
MLVHEIWKVAEGKNLLESMLKVISNATKVGKPLQQVSNAAEGDKQLKQS